MRVAAILNPENGNCIKALTLLYKLSQAQSEIKEVYLVLENTYHAEKWVLSLSMPVSKQDIESIKKRYYQKIMSEWEAISGNLNLPIKVEVNDSNKVVEQILKEDLDLLLIGCVENKHLCKLIEKLDIPVLVVKN